MAVKLKAKSCGSYSELMSFRRSRREVRADGDSLAAIAIGHATLTVRFLGSSILSDSVPALQQPIRVRP